MLNMCSIMEDAYDINHSFAPGFKSKYALAITVTPESFSLVRKMILSPSFHICEAWQHMAQRNTHGGRAVQDVSGIRVGLHTRAPLLSARARTELGTGMLGWLWERRERGAIKQKDAYM